MGRRASIQTVLVGTYLEDGTQLVQVLAVDSAEVIAEDCMTDDLVRIKPIALAQKWRPVNA